MSHYFDYDSSIASKERTVSLEINGQKITFISDNGVFSKSRVDEGSLILLQVLIPLHLSGRILDLGSGYGPIGLTITIFSEDANVTLAEINPKAVELAKKNTERLGLSNRVTCLQSDIYEKVEGPYDSIVVNPPIRAGKIVTYRMYREAKQYLMDGGSFYFVIRKAQGAVSAAKYVEEIFGNVTLLKREKGYYIYKAIKRN